MKQGNPGRLGNPMPTNSVGASLPGAALLLAPNPILRKRARELTDRERAHTAGPLIARLFAVMEAHNGAGLAAPQIGESLRVFVMGNESFVNPVIIERSDETIAYEEGCLSLPGVLVNVQRHVTVTLQTAGRIVRLTGQSARIAQHEIDHLDGVLIIDRGAALEAGPYRGEQSHETERPDAPDTISLLRTNLVGANRRVGDLTGLLLEWLDTPFFATEADWRAWVEDFRPRVLAVIQGATNSQSGVRGESLPNAQNRPVHISGCASEVGRPCNCGGVGGEEP